MTTRRINLAPMFEVAEIALVKALRYDDEIALPAETSMFDGERPFEMTISHLHDWRERCNACHVCELHDGFHDEARHRDRVTIPAACLLPSADVKRQAARVVRTPEEIEAVRAARAAQREE